VWQALIPVAPGPDAVWFVDVTYKVKALMDGRRFALSSLPALPADLVPRIRAVDTCQ
jgi:hypothetical protein